MNRVVAGIRRYELPIVTVALVAAVASLPLFFDGATLWTRRFWLDELCCLLYPVNDATSFFDLFATVRRSDVAPPLLHMIAWTVGKLTGSLSPVVVRSIAVNFTILALLVLWVVLRRRFSITATAAAVLAVASHSLVLHHAFDGRFYAPWLFFAVSYIGSLNIDADKPRSRRRDIAVGVFALCLCTIHWFGVTSLAVMAAAAVAAHGRRWKDGLRLVAPSVVGVVALLLLIPTMLSQLGAGGEDLLWIQPLNMDHAKQFAQTFFIRVPIILAVLILLAGLLRPADQRARIAPLLRDPAMAALLATGMMTFVLMLISVTMNSVMVTRYAIASVLLAAPIVALAAESIRPWQRVLLALIFAILLGRRLESDLRHTRYFAGVTETFGGLLDELRSEPAPIVFHSFFLMYPVDGQARSASRIRVLDVPDSTIEAMLPDPVGMAPLIRKLRLDRNQARLHYRTFGFPIPITQVALDSAPRFYFFARNADITLHFTDVQTLGRVLFPRHRSVRLNEFVTVFERAGAPR